MPIMEWNADLDIGVEDMNAEHQRLLDIMNRLYDKSHDGVTGAEIVGLVDELGKYTVEHFQHEEKFMDDIGFVDAEKHKRIHADLLKKYGEHAESIRSANGVASDKFFHFLSFWLSAHIKGLDTKYGAHANKLSQAS